MSTRAERLRHTVWERQGVRGWVAWLALQPASGVFAAAVAARNFAYRSGILRVQRAGIPVISIGNLAVGGTGKTPITLWLARQLAARGTRVAILLRGYSGSSREVSVVSTGAGPQVDVDTVGDEAVMLAKCFDGAVLTAPRRIDGVRAAERLGCRAVVLDDGFQHRALARDFDLVLLNGRGGSLLPAGPMREPRRALGRADAVALVAKHADEHLTAPAAVRRLAKPVFAVRFAPTALVESDAGAWRELPLGLLSGRRVAVIAGIADPTGFYTTVRQWEGQVEEILEFPDHYRYTAADWQYLARATRDVELVVTTEKDLVKLEHFPFAKGKLVALRIAPQIDGGEALLRLVQERAGLLPRAAIEEGADGHQ